MAKYLSHKIRAGLKDDMMYDGWCSWEFVPATQSHYDGNACAYNRHRTHWCVPMGVSCAIFEIWGGGGSGAGSMCCSVSTPSGAGAYAKKTIPVRAGECYFTHVGYQGCCIACNSTYNRTSAGTCRDRGRDTYVIGRGLNNFCAEVGYGGVGICFIKNQFDSANAPAYGMTGFKTVGDGATAPNAAFTGDSSAFFCQYTGMDSGCARYFGADEGARGLPGFIQLGGDSNFAFGTYANKPCALKFGVPYPGGVYSCQGGHVIGYYCNADGLGGSEMINKGPMAAGIHCVQYPYIISSGWGTAGVWTNGSSCCCSSPSMPGRVRITYR